MANKMLERLREKDKKGYFKPTQVSVGYPTGFYPFDYVNGYRVKVVDKDEKLISSYASTGIFGGTINTIIGKSGVAKTTWVVQTAFNIVKPFDDNAFVLMYDLEQASNYTRIKGITGATQQELNDKILLRQEKNYLEDIFDSIIEIANYKNDNATECKYDTGLLDEFGNPIKIFVPTVVIIDSLPSLYTKDTDEEMKGNTDAARMAKALKQFFVKLLPVIKTYNITVFIINHITAKVDINPFAKTQAQIMYLKQDESIPGGNTPLYLSNNFIKFVSSTKYKMEDDGFDGFMVRVELIKSRSNKAGQSCNLIYDQSRGFDPLRTLYEFANDNGLVDGRNPSRYFKGHETVKFDSRKFRAEFYNKPELREILHDVVQPKLDALLSDVDSE